MGQESSSPVDESIPPQTLKDRTLGSVAQFIRDGYAKNIVVMVGALGSRLTDLGLTIRHFFAIGWCWYQHLCWNTRFSITRHRVICQLSQT